MSTLTPSVNPIEPTPSVPLSANAVWQEERLTPYLWHLLFFVSIATLFEGYDAVITGMALPYLGKDFGVGPKELGFATSVISIGTIVAFVPVRLADRYGRRPLLLLSVSGYSLFTILTAFSTGLYDFVLYQFIARALMVTEIGVGAVVLAEELPARYRGIGVAVMIGAGALGFLLAASLFSLFADTTLGWRWLYLSGGGLLPVVGVYWRTLRETQRWLEQQHVQMVHAWRGWRQSVVEWSREMKVVYQPQYRGRLVAVTALWFSTNFWSGLLYFLPYYVINERGWTPGQLSTTLLLAHTLGLLGYILAGPLLDGIGRKPTVYLYFGLGGIVSMVCFIAQASPVITVCYTATIAMMAIWTISATISAEVFPTSMRATANAVTNNLQGRIGMVLAPALVGALSSTVGSVGTTVALLVPGVWLCIPLVWCFLPETRRKTLEDIA
jgi:putative MFS transporter